MTRLLVGRVSAVRSKTMAAIRARDTGPEIQLRKALSAQGMRYRLHKKGLPGRPDIVFPRQKVVVFCDGDFWHGRKWKRMQAQGKTFSVRNSYWTKKISSNVARDLRNNRDLRRMGWIVLRFWETDIQRDPSKVAARVQQIVRRRDWLQKWV